MDAREAIGEYERRTGRSWFDDAAFGRYLAVLAEVRARREKAALILVRAAEGKQPPPPPEPLPAWTHRARAELSMLFELGASLPFQDQRSLAEADGLGALDATLGKLAGLEKTPALVAQAIAGDAREAWSREHVLPLQARAKRVAERPTRHAFIVGVRGWAHGTRGAEPTPTEVMLLAAASEIESTDADQERCRRRWEQRVRRSRLRMDVENPTWRADAGAFVRAYRLLEGDLRTTASRS